MSTLYEHFHVGMGGDCIYNKELIPISVRRKTTHTVWVRYGYFQVGIEWRQHLR